MPLLFSLLASLAFAQPAEAAAPGGRPPLGSGWTAAGRWTDDRWIPVLRLGGGQVGVLGRPAAVTYGELGVGARYQLARYQGDQLDSVAFLELRPEATYSLDLGPDALAHTFSLGPGLVYETGWVGAGVSARGVSSFSSGREPALGGHVGLLFTLLFGLVGAEVSYEALTSAPSFRASFFLDFGVMSEIRARSEPR